MKLYRPWECACLDISYLSATAARSTGALAAKEVSLLVESGRRLKNFKDEYSADLDGARSKGC